MSLEMWYILLIQKNRKIFLKKCSQFWVVLKLISYPIQTFTYAPFERVVVWVVFVFFHHKSISMKRVHPFFPLLIECMSSTRITNTNSWTIQIKINAKHFECARSFSFLSIHDAVRPVSGFWSIDFIARWSNVWFFSRSFWKIPSFCVCLVWYCNPLHLKRNVSIFKISQMNLKSRAFYG